MSEVFIMPEDVIRSAEFYERFVWKYGGPRDFWVRNIDTIKGFLRRHRISPVERLHLIADDPVPIRPRGAKRSSRVPIPRPRPFPGGLKIPHLHFEGELFVLTDAQWKEFAAGALKGFQEKLNKAGTVSFEQVMGLADAINGLG